MNKVTLMVLSCDKNEDLWYPFFKLLKRNWSDLNYPIILNTETKSYTYEDLDIKSFAVGLNQEKEKTWSERLINNLKLIQSDYVIFLLDDYFLQSKVNSEKINQCVNWMDESSNIACFNFSDLKGGKGESKTYKGFEEVGDKEPYRINLQAALWRKTFLLKLLRKHENPWYLERWGSIRSRRFKENIYTIIKKEKKTVFNYDVSVGISLGRWMSEKTKALFEVNNIFIDYEIRGFLSNDDRKNVKRKPFLVRCYNVIKSLI